MRLADEIERPFVELFELKSLPVRPCVPSDAANIADGQQVEEVEIFSVPKGLGKSPDDVVFRFPHEGKIGHLEVVVDDELDALDFLRFKTEPLADILRDDRAVSRMVAGLQLADIVQKEPHSQKDRPL